MTDNKKDILERLGNLVRKQGRYDPFPGAEYVAGDNSCAKVVHDAIAEIQALREALKSADEGLNYMHLYEASPPINSESD